MITAWNNGKFSPTGAGYGLRLDLTYRNTVFKRSWTHILLDLPNGTTVRVNLSSAFWRKCPEVRSAAIGRWLIATGHGRWPKGKPPSFTLIQVIGNHFRVV